MPKTWRYPVILPTDGSTSGNFKVKPPFAVSYVAVMNNTAASIYVAEGEVGVQPMDSLLFGAGVALTVPLDKESNVVTVFWSAATAPGATNNQAIIILSDSPINLQAGVNNSGGVASNVNVTNTISANLTGTNNVTVQPSNNLIGHVTLDDGTGKSPTIGPVNVDANSTTLSLLGSFNYLLGFNGTSWDRLRMDSQKNLLVGLRSSAGNEPAIGNGPSTSDATNAGGQQALYVNTFLTAFNGTSWDRLRVDGNKNLQVSLRSSSGNEPNISGSAGDAEGNTWAMYTMSRLQGFNGTTWDRLRVDVNKNLQVSLRSSGGSEPAVYNTNADGIGTTLTGLGSVSFMNAFDGTSYQRLRVDSAKNLNVTSNGMTALAFNQVSVSTTQTALRNGASDVANRKCIIIRNMDSSNTLFIGGNGVTTSNGYPLKPGESISFDQQPGATVTMYGIVSSGSVTVAVMEVA